MGKKRAAQGDAGGSTKPTKKKAEKPELPAGAPRKTLVVKKGKDTEDFHVGDCALVSVKDAEELGVAKILSIRSTSDKPADTKVEIQWYYRPTDTEDGWRDFYGRKELFKSLHRQWVPAESIASRAYVHSIKQYEELGREDENDFYARFTYHPGRRPAFTPLEVPIYCVCAKPYNPDLTWLLCQQCGSRFHPTCVGIADSAVKGLRSSYVCSSCAPKTTRL